MKSSREGDSKLKPIRNMCYWCGGMFETRTGATVCNDCLSGSQ